MTALLGRVGSGGWMVTVPMLSCAGSEVRLTVRVAGVVNGFAVAFSQLPGDDTLRVKETGVVASAVICVVCAVGRVLFGPGAKLMVAGARFTTVKVTGTPTD